MDETVNVLGTEYKIEIHKRSEDEFMKKMNADGYCSEDGKFIVIADTYDRDSFPDMNTEESGNYKKRLLRHEIFHAFLSESGLSVNAGAPSIAWSKNEEMVDWLAIQFPKMYAAFKSVNAT